MNLFRVLLCAVQEHNFLKFVAICVAILGDRNFFLCFYRNIYEIKLFLRYLELFQNI